MNKLLIHIGYHKTGTSWLQEQVFSSNNSVFEPLSLDNGGQSSLAEHFFMDPKGYLLSPFTSNTQQIKNSLETILKKKAAKFAEKFPVISHERLSGNPHSGGFDSRVIAHRLKDFFPKAKILIVIREQKSFLLSNYFQYLSVGGFDSIDTYLQGRYDGKRPHFSPHHINYLPLIREYQVLFGQENVLVIPYEFFREDPKEFLLRIGSFIQREITIDENAFQVINNAGASHFVNYYFRFLNLFRMKTSLNSYSPFSNNLTMTTTNFIARALCLMTPKAFDRMVQDSLKKRIEQLIGTQYSEHNRKLSEVIAFDLSKYGYF